MIFNLLQVQAVNNVLPPLADFESKIRDVLSMKRWFSGTELINQAA